MQGRKEEGKQEPTRNEGGKGEKESEGDRMKGRVSDESDYMPE